MTDLEIAEWTNRLKEKYKEHQGGKTTGTAEFQAYMDAHPTGDPTEPPRQYELIDGEKKGEKLRRVATAPHDPWQRWAAERIYGRIRKAGYSHVVALAVLINAMAESGITFSFNPHPSELSYGIFQAKTKSGEDALYNRAIAAGQKTKSGCSPT